MPPPKAPEVKAARPEPKPTVWSPRPIPGPGPGRSTADPRTPTKRDLAARAQQAAMTVDPVADPAHAAAAAGGAGTLANPTPCAGLGLANAATVRSFADGVKGLQQRWGTLDVNQRAQAFERLVNAPMQAAGAPALALDPRPLAAGYNGLMLAREWTLAVNQSFFQGTSLSNAQATELADTAFHEARHAQQWFMMAQRRAGLGATPETIASGLSVPLNVARAAVDRPIRPPARPTQSERAPSDATGTPVPPAPPQPPSPESRCAEAMHQSVYGTGRAHREQTLGELRASSAAVEAAQQRVSSLAGGTASPTDLSNAQRALVAAQQRRQAVYPTYRALPEEADAWATGSLVRPFWP